MTLFLVDRHADGVDARAIPKMGRNAVASCETTYDDVLVPLATASARRAAASSTCSTGSTPSAS